MKRGWIGVVLLLALLAGGVLSVWLMVELHDPLEGILEQAAEAALASRWERAEVLSREAQTRWEENWHVSAAFSDHAPMEEIDGLFAQLEVYRGLQDAASFAALCRELAREMKAMGEAHVPNWWNLL